MISLLARSESSVGAGSAGRERCLYGSVELMRRSEGKREARFGVDRGRNSPEPLPSLASSSMLMLGVRLVPNWFRSAKGLRGLSGGGSPKTEPGLDVCRDRES